MKQDIWIIGSSIIKRAAEHAENRPIGSNLRFDTNLYNVIWMGYPGMHWESVNSIIRAALNWRGTPSFILIHCGGNDITQVPNQELLYNMRLTFYNLRVLLPYTTLIFSYVLPRLEWKNAFNVKKIEKSRRRLNRGVRSYLSKIGCKSIKHLDFEDKYVGLFDNDKVHLSFVGNDLFLNDLQSALQLFIDKPWLRVYPVQ